VAVASHSPVVKFIGSARAHDLTIDEVRTGERPSLAGMYRVSLPPAGRFTFPAAHGYKSRVSVLAGLHSILTGSQDGERLIGRVHFKDFVPAEPLHPNVENSLRELKLHCAVI
jgi:hypothetical protein